MMRVLVNSSERSLKDLIEKNVRQLRIIVNERFAEGMNAFWKRKPIFNQD